MWRYIVKRILTLIPVLFGVSMLVFSFVQLIPGDPAVAMLGERATARASPGCALSSAWTSPCTSST